MIGFWRNLSSGPGPSDRLGEGGGEEVEVFLVVWGELSVRMGMAEVWGEGEGGEILLEDLVDDGETVPIGVF